MFNIITLITIITSLMSPTDLKPAYYQEFDLIGEIPEISSNAPSDRIINTTEGYFPEVVVTALRPTPEEMRYWGIMPEISVTAERYSEVNTDPVHHQPRLQIDYSQSSVKNFYIYALLITSAVLLFAIGKVLLPLIFRPAIIAVNRTQIKHRSYRR